MLCVHLLCFSAMFLLISTRLHGKKMGMEVFAIGNFLLGSAYVLQLVGGPPGWNAMSVVNHTLTLCAPAVYAVGAMRFFGRAAPLWRPLLTLALAYAAAQIVVQWTLGTEVRYAMLAGASALLFLAMTATVIQGAHTFARDLRAEMVLFAVLIGGIFALNAMKFVMVLKDGLEALDMNSRFQTVFYLYMSFLATVLAPSVHHLAGAAQAHRRTARHGGPRPADAAVEPSRHARRVGCIFPLTHCRPCAPADRGHRSFQTHQ